MKSRVALVSADIKWTRFNQGVVNLPLHAVQVFARTLHTLQCVRRKQIPVTSRTLASLAGLIVPTQASRLQLRAQIRQTTPIELSILAQTIVANPSGNLLTPGTTSPTITTVSGIRRALQAAIITPNRNLVASDPSASHTLVATLPAHPQIRGRQPRPTLPPNHLESVEDRHALIPSHVTNAALFKLLVVRQRCTVYIRRSLANVAVQPFRRRRIQQGVAVPERVTLDAGLTFLDALGVRRTSPEKVSRRGYYNRCALGVLWWAVFG